MTRSDFAAAYEKGYASTVRFLLSTGVPPDTVDDVAQAAWVHGWEKRKQLKEPRRIVGWINRISLNLFRNQIRRQRPTSDLVELPCRPGISPVAIDLRRGLSRCTAEEQELLTSYYLQGYTSGELGRRTHCSPEAIRVRVLRAKRRLLNFVCAPPPGRTPSAA